MANADALLAHILSQTKANIDFLISQKQISQADGRDILAKLPIADDGAVVALSQQTRNLALTQSEPTPSANNSMVPTRRGVPPPPKRTMQVRALWDWNNNGENQSFKDPNDLSFKSGDVFEVITETNADWWTGRHNGRQGLFPSNYVEKIGEHQSPSSPNEKQIFSANHDRAAQPYSPGYPSPQYQPPMGPPMGYQNPPMVYNPYPAGPPVQQQQQPPPEQQQPPKKSRFGGMGNTLAQSAVGGVGFGAGSAVGSGIINSIF